MAAIREHVLAALAAAGPGPVAKGNVGGGTGMICHEFKGGIGTSPRVAEAGGEHCTVGALVQANYGARDALLQHVGSITPQRYRQLAEPGCSGL